MQSKSILACCYRQKRPFSAFFAQALKKDGLGFQKAETKLIINAQPLNDQSIINVQ